MNRNLTSLLVLCGFLLFAGYLIGYVVDHTTMQTYRLIGRSLDALAIAAAVLFVSGVIYRITTKRLSSLNGILLMLVVSSICVLKGFYVAIGP